jgi:hypothetical protein
MTNLEKACVFYGWQGGTIHQVSEKSGIPVNDLLESKDIIALLISRQPRYAHDCSSCVFLGQFGEYDLYFCPGETTLLCRFGDEGHEYKSGFEFALCFPGADHFHYTEALYRALQVPACKERILATYKRPAVFDERWERFQELVTIAETPKDRLPLLIHDIKHVRLYYQFKLKEVL